MGYCSLYKNHQTYYREYSVMSLPQQRPSFLRDPVRSVSWDRSDARLQEPIHLYWLKQTSFVVMMKLWAFVYTEGFYSPLAFTKHC